MGSLAEPCPHPARDGQHEVYLTRDGEVCRACGARASSRAPARIAARLRALADALLGAGR